MKRRFFAVALIAILAATTLTGCNSNQEKDTTSRYQYTSSTTSSMLESDSLVTPAEDEVVSSETVTNEDGSTTTTETLEDGSVVATTTNTDGTVTTTETKSDGSVTKTETKSDGSVVKTETAGNGTVTTTETKPDGSQSVTTTPPSTQTGGGSTTTPPSTGTTTTPTTSSTPSQSTSTPSTPSTPSQSTSTPSTPSTPSQSTSTPTTSTPTTPTYVTADADDAEAVATRALEYINQWRAQEGKAALVALPNATAYTNIRAQQLITNFAHDQNDMITAATQLHYGMYVEKNGVGTYVPNYTGPEPFYSPFELSEVITEFGWVSDSTTLERDIDQVALHMATNWKNSSSHWAALSSSDAHFIGISASYQGNCWRGIAITLADATYG